MCAIKDPAAAPGPLKIAVHKVTLTVPNYWSNDFQISSVFVANKVTPLTEVPTGDAQKLKPYVIGNLEGLDHRGLLDQVVELRVGGAEFLIDVRQGYRRTLVHVGSFQASKMV